MMFEDRLDAGRQLAKAVAKLKIKSPVVLAIPRGGAVVGKFVADELKARMHLVIPRKLGAPGNDELAIGAVAENGEVFLDKGILGMFDVPDSYIERKKKEEVAEIWRRRRAYGDKLPGIKGKTVVIVDDGVATGSTMMVAIRFVKGMGAKRVIAAVPVGPPDTIKELEREAEVVCLQTPDFFSAVGQFYRSFNQTTDKEVLSLLR